MLLRPSHFLECVPKAGCCPQSHVGLAEEHYVQQDLPGQPAVLTHGSESNSRVSETLVIMTDLPDLRVLWLGLHDHGQWGSS